MTESGSTGSDNRRSVPTGGEQHMVHTTYVFAATREAVASQPFLLPVAQLFPALRERHVGVAYLMVLAALLAGRDLAELAQDRRGITVFAKVASRWFPMVRDLGAEWGCERGDCPIVRRVPAGFATLLAQLTGEQLAGSAKAWAATPWWGPDGRLPPRQAARIALYLRDLARVAARARNEGKALHLWTGGGLLRPPGAHGPLDKTADRSTSVNRLLNLPVAE